jgi:hypothetical protein
MSAQADGKASPETAQPALTESTTYKLLKHPLRHKILIRTGERPWCPAELAEDIGEPLKRVCEQIRVLVDHAPPCLELVGKRPGPHGGPPRRFYRALVRVNVNHEEWSRLTPLEQAQQTATITEELHKEWIDSINCGAFYSDIDHTLMRTAMTLDREGMARINAMLLEVQARFSEVEREAAERRDQKGSDAIRVITGLVSFRAAPK